MAINKTNLACFIEANREPLITNLPYGSPSINLLAHRTGVKCQEAIGFLGVDVEFQDCSCSKQPAGNINLSDRLIKVGCIDIYDTICDIEFLCTRYEQEIRRTAGKESLGSLEEWIVRAVLMDIQNKLEIAIWQGDTASANANLNKFDGLLKILQASPTDPELPGVPTANRISQTAGQTDYQFIRSLTTNPAFIRASMRGRMAFIVGLDRFASITGPLTDIRINFIENPTIPGGFREIYQSAQEFTLPGTNYRVIGVPGLTGTNKVVVGSLDNLFWATDYADDRETLKFDFNDEHDYWWYKVKFFSGTGVGFVDEVIIGTFTSDITVAQNLTINTNIVGPLGDGGGVLTETVAAAFAGAMAQLSAAGYTINPPIADESAKEEPKAKAKVKSKPVVTESADESAKEE